MAYCSNCGTRLQDSATRCNVCGAPQTPVQQPQYQPPQYQQPQYQPPQQGYPNTWSLPKSGGQAPNGYPQSQELYPRQTPQQPQYQQYQQYQQSAPGSYPPPPVPPAKPPKKNKKGLVILFICLGVLLAAILGVGGWLLLGNSGGDDEVLGRYEIISCEEDGEELETNDEWILLAKQGKATLYLDEETFSAKWKLDGEDLTVTQDGDKYYGTLEDGILTLELDGVTYTFSKDGEKPDEGDDEPAAAAGEAPEVPTQAPTEAPAGVAPVAPADAPEAPTEAPAQPPESESDLSLGWWEGEWYGWWIVTTGVGDWAEMEDVAFDVCGRITVDEGSGTGYVSIWDEDDGDSQVRWEVEVGFVESYDDRGMMVSGDGDFWGESMEPGDWRVDPTEYPYSDFENFICISGTDPYTGSEYSIYLRPWGTRWEDIRNGDMSAMPYTDMMPIRYDSWYLPLINAGAAMPDAFGIED